MLLNIVNLKYAVAKSGKASCTLLLLTFQIPIEAFQPNDKYKFNVVTFISGVESWLERVSPGADQKRLGSTTARHTNFQVLVQSELRKP